MMERIVVTAIILSGIALCLAVVGVFVLAFLREDKERSLFPWGARGRVEKARAAAEIAELDNRREKADILRLALEPQRQAVLDAIAKGEAPPLDELPALNGGSKAGDDIRSQVWGSG